MVKKEVVVVVVAVTTMAAAVVSSAVMLRRWQRRMESRRQQRQRILRKFARDSATPASKLWEVANALAGKMETSLSTKETDLGVLVSCADSLPNGEEKGLYYGVSLRSRNFLILCARLGGKNNPISDLHKRNVSFPENVLRGTSEDVLDFVASEVAKFSAVHPENKTESEGGTGLGFTISYPVEQPTAGIDSSNCAIKWKSFALNEPVQKQLLEELNSSLDRNGVKMQVVALVGDPVGELAGGRYYSQDSVAAVTLGMGTNAAYIEPVESVAQWRGPSPMSGEVVVALEWGNFNCCQLPITEFDYSLDKESSNSGVPIFEKLVSGTYLGEIVRKVLLKMAQEAALFGETVPIELKIPYKLSLFDISAMHQDTSEGRDVIAEKLKDIFKITRTSLKVREVVAEVCDIVAERGARLAASGIVGIVTKLRRIDNKKSKITIEGALYEQYRVFRNYLHSGVWEMLGNDLSDNIVLEHAHGGSGSGAVFIAANQSRNIES